MSTSTHNVKRRLDYSPPNFLVDSVELIFHLNPDKTRVESKTKVHRQGEHTRPLILDGQDMTLLSVSIDGKEESDYQLSEASLILQNVPDNFVLTITTEIDPANNSSLEGLYQSAGAYCTQCEAEGFRKITYFMDRPDVLAEYRVKIIADKEKYPYLLSNGNKVGAGDADNGNHWVEWHDPFKKPCYLFALVAGDFDLLTDTFVTCSGRTIDLELFVDKGKLNRGQHALDSLKKAMAWDERVFGLEYDLDIYMIVAVDFFNMGAMENKGLNVFNSKFVLADANTATDEDYYNIESVIAHEYFHNWTGNRVTCRDWFQLSLKEGLTVFRDQQFSADMSSPVVNRIKNVKIIREHQFAEDASAMSHPIRPDEVMEMNNFYTVTVYDKGAEVIRMIYTLLGEKKFRKGMDLYFSRFDGQAVTCDDFVQAMQDASEVDLTLFKRWYEQSGTPLLQVSDRYNVDSEAYELSIKQINQATSDQATKQTLHIPIKFELLEDEVNSNENKLPAGLINLIQDSQSFSYEVKKQRPTPVLLNDFSAPVKLEYEYSDKQLKLIAKNSSDAFSRWDASQALYSKYIHAASKNELDLNDKRATSALLDLVSDCQSICETDPALGSEMLTLPSFETLCQQVENYDVDKLFSARKLMFGLIAQSSKDTWLSLYEESQSATYQYSRNQVDLRRIKNLSLSYLSSHHDMQSYVSRQYEQSDNMTDTLGALKAAQLGNLELFDNLMLDFEQKWQNDALVLDKWFGLHANVDREDILSRISLLTSHKGFNLNNPNRVRALIGTFTFFNPMGFHAKDGSGYRFITDYLLKLDKINPQVSARIVTPLTQWQNLDDSRQDLMCTQLARLMNEENLSSDLYEKVSKSLNFRP